MEDILVIQNLSKHYGDQVALDSLSLKLKKGEIYGLIGQNGAGKSTLIKLITQIIRTKSRHRLHFGLTHP